MNISHQKIDNIAKITINLAPEDYNPAVDKAIKDQAKKAKLPGFRPGMVPASHIRRTFGKAILFDEINRLIKRKDFGIYHRAKTRGIRPTTSCRR
ncbi:trigger factor family protein [Sphingobacterium sp. T2]|uniref:trigger factor family protein n=1 Tax=Sphingobacterium sp. T2 TaxID=1590596 RepID=UPI000AF525FF|nr:trigger factor family protein [Sphingobacterium sp. T2]